MDALFNTNISPSPEDITFQTIITKSNGLFFEMTLTLDQLYNQFWNNPNLTPQQVCDVLDTKGIPPATFFRLAGLLINLLNIAKPNAIDENTYKPKKAVAISLSSGKVTVDDADDSGTISYVE